MKTGAENEEDEGRSSRLVTVLIPHLKCECGTIDDATRIDDGPPPIPNFDVPRSSKGLSQTVVCVAVPNEEVGYQ